MQYLKRKLESPIQKNKTQTLLICKSDEERYGNWSSRWVSREDSDVGGGPLAEVKRGKRR